jgi:hypothetical protein
MIKVGRSVVKGSFKVIGRTVSEAALIVTEVPGGDTVALRRIGFGASMVLDPRGSTLLDVLGDDCDERAAVIGRFLSRCTDEELTELLMAFQESAQRRALRNAATA